MKKKTKRATYKDVMVDPQPKSIWDKGVDYDKVMKLSPQDRQRLFPNDFGYDGKPRGDF